MDLPVFGEITQGTEAKFRQLAASLGSAREFHRNKRDLRRGSRKFPHCIFDCLAWGIVRDDQDRIAQARQLGRIVGGKHGTAIDQDKIAGIAKMRHELRHGR